METLKNLTLIQWIGIAVGLNSLLMGATPQLTVLFGEHAVPYIGAIATLGNGALGVFVTVIGGQGSQVRNVLAMPGVERIAVNGQAGGTLAAIAVDPLQNKIAPTPAAMDKVTATAAKAVIMLVLLIGGLFAFPGDASAQAPKLTGNLTRDIAAAAGNKAASSATSKLDDIAAALAKPFKDIADFIGGDADGAITLSTVIPKLQDGHGQQCWMAMQSYGDVIKAHPVPITFRVIQDYETLRLLGMATNNLCSNVHCTQVFADLTAMAQAASPVTLAIPSLHDLCTKVPQIAVVPPVSVPAPAATPTPN